MLNILKLVWLAAHCALLFLTACGQSPARPWGDQPVREVLQKGDCTVYALVSDPQTYWVICAPGDHP